MGDKRINKAITIGLNSAMIASAVIAPISTSSAVDVEVNDSVKIRLINNNTGLYINPTNSMRIDIFSDETKEYIVDGNIIKDNGYLEFKSKSNMPEDQEYKFRVISDEYEDFEGTLVFSKTTSYEIKLDEKEEEKEVAEKEVIKYEEIANEEEDIDQKNKDLENIKTKAIEILKKEDSYTQNAISKINSAVDIDEVSLFLKDILDEKALEDERVRLEKQQAEEDALYTLNISTDDLNRVLNLLNSLDLTRQNSSVRENISKARNIIANSNGKFKDEERDFISLAFNNIDRDLIRKSQINKIPDINNIVRLFARGNVITRDRSEPSTIKLNFYENGTSKSVIVYSNEIEFFDINNNPLDLILDSGYIRNYGNLDFEDVIKIKVKKEGYFEFNKDLQLSKDFKTENLTLKKIPEVEIKSEDINKIYGDKDFLVSDKITLPRDYTGNVEYFIEQGENYIDLVNGKVIIKRPGQAIIGYVASNTDKYRGVVGKFKVNISKKDLGTIEANDILWENTEKTYDTKRDILLNGTFKKELGLIGNDKIDIEALALSEDKNVGKKKTTYQKYTITGDARNYYTYKIDMSGPEIEINHLNIDLSLEPFEIKYGSKEWEDVKNNRLPDSIKIKNIIKLDSDVDRAIKLEYDKEDLSKNVEISFKRDSFYVGEVKNGFEVNLKNQYLGNFSLNLKEKSETIKILPSTYTRATILENILLDKEGSNNIYERNGQLYVAPGSVVAYKIKDTTLYDKLNITTTNLNTEQKDTNKILIPFDKEDGYVKANVFLSKEGNPDTKTNTVAMPDNMILVDSDAPKVEFKNGLLGYGFFNTTKEKVNFSNPDEAFKFTKKYSKEGYKVVVDVKDDKSGIKNTEYAVMKVKNDKEARDLLESAKSNSTIKWQTLSSNEITIRSTTDGYYLVLVKSMDNLGNESIYASNGIAIDITAPKILIEGFEDKLYTNDINYNIQVSDKFDGKAYVGIEDIIVNVYNNEKLIGSNKANTNSFKKNKSELFSGLYKGDVDTFEEFDNTSGPVNIKGVIEANGNNIRLEIIVKDQVGNETSKTVINPIMIDKTQARVNATFDNNEYKNGKYFNKDRILTLNINERNYKEENLLLNIGVDGVRKQYSINDIREGKAYGVEIVEDRKDNQANLSINQYTDERVNSYKILFGSKNEKISVDYDLDINYVDNNKRIPAEFNQKDKNINRFSIDEIPPELDIVFFNDLNREIYVSEDKNNPYYTQTLVTPKLIVKERNFDKRDVNINLIARGFDGKSVNAYNFNNLNDIYNNDWNRDNRYNNSFVLKSFENDANYGIAMAYTDLAGNEAKFFNYRYFSIDKTSPDATMKAVYNGSEIDYYKLLSSASARGALKTFMFTLFGKNTITFKNTHSDKTSGIKSIGYYVEYINNNSSYYESASDLERLPWKNLPKDSNISVRDDMAAIIYQRIEDRAGNITYLSSSGAFVKDSKNPNEPQIMISDVKNNVFNTNIKIGITAKDPDNGGRGFYSGIKKLSYTIRDDITGEITQKGILADYLSDKDSRKQVIQREIEVDSKNNNSNSLTLEVFTEDYSGNKATAKRTFSIDATAPKISSSLDKTGERNGKYYNSTREVSVDITERNYSEKDTILSLKVNGKKLSYNFEEIRNGKASNSGIELLSARDNQSNTKVNTDSRQIRYKLAFGSGLNVDYDYEDISFVTTDKAQNRSNLNKEIKDFIVDKVAPSIDVGYYNGSDITGYVTRNKDIPYFSQSDIIPTIQIKDKRFRKDFVTVRLEQFDGKGRSLNSYSQISSVNYDSWRVNGDEYLYSMPNFTNDGIYGLSLEYEDLAGNKAIAYDARYFSVDKTAPDGSIQVYNNGEEISYESLSNTSVFRNISNKEITVGRKADDDISGLASIAYYIDYPDVDTQGEFYNLTRSDLRNVDWINWDNDLSINVDSQMVIYQRVIDRAGNITYRNTEGAIIVDQTTPFTPDITITEDGSSNDIHYGDATVSINVKDQVINNSYSGLKALTIEVYNRGEKTQSVRYDISDEVYRNRDFNASITVDSTLNNSNNVIVRAIVEDNAGNISNSEKSLFIDVTPPRIEVLYDVDASGNKRYYNNGRVATIRVYERNFDPSSFILDIKGGRANVGSWQIGSEAGISDNNLNTLQVFFMDDADYDFTFSLKDEAGNKAEYGNVDSFTVDQTKPTIDISFDKPLVNGKYINSKRVATITVKETNFDPRDFKAQINASLDGKSINPPAISGFATNGDTHTASIVFENDGDYSLTLNYTDLAGNVADEKKVEEFTIDTVAPEITFENVENEKSYKDELVPEVVLNDVNFDKDNIDISLIGIRHEEIKLDGTFQSEGENKGRFIIDHFPIEKEFDDIYTLKVKNIDKAGNETEKEIKFSVNRYGSNYYFGENTSRLAQKFYNNQEEDIEIFEINPDELEESSVTISLDGSSKTLKPNEYKRSKIKSDGRNEYKYVISKENFKKEGVYEISVDSKDLAGNIQSSKIKEKPLRFVIDKTSPSAVITGVENNTVYDDLKRDIKISVEDNNKLSSLELYVDNVLVKTFNKDDIERYDFKLPYTIDEKGKWQSIKAVVKDAAGNESTTNEVSVLVSSNMMTRLINDRRFILGMSAGFIALVSLILVLFKKRNDKRNEEFKNL